jgi:hypothetical protein
MLTTSTSIKAHRGIVAMKRRSAFKASGYYYISKDKLLKGEKQDTSIDL